MNNFNLQLLLSHKSHITKEQQYNCLNIFLLIKTTVLMSEYYLPLRIRTTVQLSNNYFFLWIRTTVQMSEFHPLLQIRKSLTLKSSILKRI